jgi:hypothetical protein
MVENISYTDGLITYKQGTNANLILSLSKNGALSALAGYSAILVIQKSYASPTTYATLSAEINNIANGAYMNFKFLPGSLETITLTTDFVDMVYQIKITDDLGNVSIPLRGTIRIYKELA